jgi:hypothetical protein
MLVGGTPAAPTDLTLPGHLQEVRLRPAEIDIALDQSGSDRVDIACPNAPDVKCKTRWRETLALQGRIICERSWAAQHAAAHFRHFCWATTTS